VSLSVCLTGTAWLLLAGCAGQSGPSPAPSPAGPSIDLSSQARATREACSALIERDDAMELVDFSTFARAAVGIWDASVRVRKGGALTRVGCRHIVASSETVVFDPATPPALPAGAVALSTTASPSPATVSEPVATGAPAPVVPTAATVTAPVAATAPNPPDRLASDLSWVPDPAARANIARVRDACLAAAARKKLTIESIDSFQRAAGSSTLWEAALVSRRRGKATTHLCTYDQVTQVTALK
jgi:hypothetical protein